MTASAPIRGRGGCRVVGAALRDETISSLGGDVYTTAMTWTADDQQMVAFIDGAGWPETPQNHYYSSRIFTVSGCPQDATFDDILEYPDIPLSDIYKNTVP